VIEQIYRQTEGQPFLVNRLAQILTEEMNIPLNETITLSHFDIAHRQLLDEPNVHLSHLTRNIRRKPAFERLLMSICLDERGISFNLRNDLISELVSYGILKRGEDGFCEISNPIYQYNIVQTFQPLSNGLEDKYLPEESVVEFSDYLTPEGKIDCHALLVNFRDFIKRAGYRILEVPDTPQEFVGQYLLFAYLDAFVRQIRGFMYVEVRTGRGRMDLIILHKGDKYIVETKLWRSQRRYDQGKIQLASYLKSEGIPEGYYVVFDHRQSAQERFEEEIVNGKRIVSYCISVSRSETE
ncbi:hypothetical protein HYR99_14250, partial [Candidatus Poribacteria bacterium]|nr:hypothetical protein [Candidatus Poribacteria bacterium]